MCKSLPSSALAFDLYSACPFEFPPVVPAAGPAVTAPEPAAPGGVQPVQLRYMLVDNGPHRSMHPGMGYYDIRWGAFDDSFWHGGDMDAPERVPFGGVRYDYVPTIDTGFIHHGVLRA